MVVSSVTDADMDSRKVNRKWQTVLKLELRFFCASHIFPFLALDGAFPVSVVGGLQMLLAHLRDQCGGIRHRPTPAVMDGDSLH